MPKSVCFHGEWQDFSLTAFKAHQFCDIYTAPWEETLQAGNTRSGHCTKHGRKHTEV